MEWDFKTFNYRGSFWIFFLITAPILLLWFIASAVISDLLPIHMLIVFLTGSTFIIYLIAKFRYKKNGIIHIGSNQISHLTSRGQNHWRFDNDLSLSIYYSDKHFLIDGLGSLGGFYRYNSLNYSSYTSPEATDRISIDNVTYYLKVRNRRELKALMDAIDFLRKQEISLKVYRLVTDAHGTMADEV